MKSFHHYPPKQSPTTYKLVVGAVCVAIAIALAALAVGLAGALSSCSSLTVAPAPTPPPAQPSVWARTNLKDRMVYTGTDQAGNAVQDGRGYIVTDDFVLDYRQNLAAFGSQLNHPKPDPNTGIASLGNGLNWASEQVFVDEAWMRTLKASPQLNQTQTSK